MFVILSLFILHRRQQSSQLQSTPTDKKSTNSETRSSLVFLAPTKKGWGVQSSSASHYLQAWCQSLIVINLLPNHLCSSSSVRQSTQYCCNTLLNFSVHLLLVNATHHFWSIFAHHYSLTTALIICSTAHQYHPILLVFIKISGSSTRSLLYTSLFAYFIRHLSSFFLLCWIDRSKPNKRVLLMLFLVFKNPSPLVHLLLQKPLKGPTNYCYHYP